MLVIGLLTFFSIIYDDSPDTEDVSVEKQIGSLSERAWITIFMLVGGIFLRYAGSIKVKASDAELDPEDVLQEPGMHMIGNVDDDAMGEAGTEMDRQAAGESLSFDERIRRLQKLRQDGLISAQEFEATKRKILEDA